MEYQYLHWSYNFMQSHRRQLECRYTIDAGYQLNIKGLRYLRTVIVTAAVNLYWHWAGVGQNTY